MDKKRNIFKLLVVFATLALLFFNFNISDEEYTQDTTYFSPNTRIHFIDIGQGDSTIIESNGEYMLIDTGEGDKWEKLKSYIDSLNIQKFQFVIATHPHSDHIGSMSKVIDNYDIENFIMPEVTSNSKTFENMANSIL
ncbi:MAG: MBL fold metallo-hydrolase, partial [Lachnospirales bacterium]